MNKDIKYFVFGICLAFVLFSAFASAGVVLTSATTIYVPDNYAKIQDAVNAASIGDTIIVREGTYYENLKVDKQLTIKSENGSANCIVDGGGSGDVITLNADGITIEGFTVRDSGSWPYADAGIKVVSNSNKIAYNSITNNLYGISLWYSSNNNIHNNNVNSNNYYGIVLSHSSNNIYNNNASNNEVGICLWDSSNNSISNNVMNSDGIHIGGSQLQYWNTHTIEGNTVNGKTSLLF